MGRFPLHEGGIETMRLYEAMRELFLTLADAWECGDLVGHLKAWWQVVTGKEEVE